MKILTTKKAMKFHPEFGRVEQITYHLFGVKILTENFLPEAEPQQPEIKNDPDLEEMTGYIEWRAKMKVMSLTNEQYTNVANTRF